jgi:hypothetical protein
MQPNFRLKHFFHILGGLVSMNLADKVCPEPVPRHLDTTLPFALQQFQDFVLFDFSDT